MLKKARVIFAGEIKMGYYEGVICSECGWEVCGTCGCCYNASCERCNCPVTRFVLDMDKNPQNKDGEIKNVRLC